LAAKTRYKHFGATKLTQKFTFTLSNSFYPRDAMLARVFARATCPSVCLSHAGIVSKRTKIISSPSGSPTILHRGSKTSPVLLQQQPH